MDPLRLKLKVYINVHIFIRVPESLHYRFLCAIYPDMVKKKLKKKRQ